MSMPRFTAEASLYKTSGQYRTGRYTVNSSAPMISPMYPAAIDVGHEVIVIHDPWTPQTEPPVIIDLGGTPGGGFTGEGPGGGGGDGRPRASGDKCSSDWVNNESAMQCFIQGEEEARKGVKHPHYVACAGGDIFCCKDNDRGAQYCIAVT
jgi:hypothetical protein